MKLQEAQKEADESQKEVGNSYYYLYHKSYSQVLLHFHIFSFIRKKNKNAQLMKYYYSPKGNIHAFLIRKCIFVF